MLHEEPPHPVAVLRRLLGGAAVIATVALAFILLEEGRVEWRLVAFITVLTALLGFASDVFQAAEAFVRLIFQGSTGLTPREEAEFLEQRLSAHPPPDKEVLWSVRLAELYRRHLYDAARANAILDQLLVKYPDSRIVRHARGLTAPTTPEEGG